VAVDGFTQVWLSNFYIDVFCIIVDMESHGIKESSFRGGFECWVGTVVAYFNYWSNLVV